MITGANSTGVNFRGCVFTTKAKPVGSPGSYWWVLVESSNLGEVPAINLARCVWSTESSPWLLIVGSASGQIFTNPGWPPAYALESVAITANLPARFITEAESIIGVVKDANGIPRNILTNFIL